LGKNFFANWVVTAIKVSTTVNFLRELLGLPECPIFLKQNGVKNIIGGKKRGLSWHKLFLGWGNGESSGGLELGKGLGQKGSGRGV